MSILLSEFDPDQNAVLQPSLSHPKIEGFPKIAISTFSHLLVDHFAKNNNAKVIASFNSANGKVPVYEVNYKNTQIALYMSCVGAPPCGGNLEEIIAFGAEKVLLFGSCGVLRHDIADGNFIVPTSALRDEGLSYHYQPPSDEILLDPLCIRAITTTLDELKIPYVTGKTWTTDAFYRETKDKVARRKAAGCIAVEMECAAMVAISKFRNIKFAQFLFAADNLDCTNWDPRGLRDLGVNYADQYMAVALESAIKL